MREKPGLSIAVCVDKEHIIDQDSNKGGPGNTAIDIRRRQLPCRSRIGKSIERGACMGSIFNKKGAISLFPRAGKAVCSVKQKTGGLNKEKQRLEIAILTEKGVFTLFDTVSARPNRPVRCQVDPSRPVSAPMSGVRPPPAGPDIHHCSKVYPIILRPAAQTMCEHNNSVDKL